MHKDQKREFEIESTINIFSCLFDYVRPVLPAELMIEMKNALEQLLADYNLSMVAVEDTMIVFGKKVWPYRKAYSEMIALYENKIGEKFLLARLPKKLHKDYQSFLKVGGTIKDLLAHKPGILVSPKDREDLASVMVEVKKDLMHHVAQAVHSTEKKNFENKVIEFREILNDIEKKLDKLREMADEEQEHPRLADEIRSEVRGFELGLCFLGPEIGHEELHHKLEHFPGRKKELNVRR